MIFCVMGALPRFESVIHGFVHVSQNIACKVWEILLKINPHSLMCEWSYFLACYKFILFIYSIISYIMVFIVIKS